MKVDPKSGIVPGPGALFGSADAENYLRALYSNLRGYRIKLDQAVELGLINGREFQDRREDLYLAALPVTLERFTFATQAFFSRTGGAAVGGRGPSRRGRVLGPGDATSASPSCFPTGAAVLVRARQPGRRSTCGSNDPTASVSNLSLSLIQPFLRGGGLAVTLEDLT